LPRLQQVRMSRKTSESSENLMFMFVFNGSWMSKRGFRRHEILPHKDKVTAA